jgi:glycine cleavage system pyridoxal-binding protein P
VFIPTQSVIKTKAKFLNLEVIVGKYTDFVQKNQPNEFFGVVVQSPDARGVVHDFTGFFKQLDDAKA